MIKGCRLLNCVFCLISATIEAGEKCDIFITLETPIGLESFDIYRGYAKEKNEKEIKKKN